MKAFIYSNQTVFYVIGAVLFLLVLYFIFKSLPTKAKKKQSKDSGKQEEKSKIEKTETEKIDLVEEIKESEEKTQEEVGKDKKADKKPKIVQIYKREHKEGSGELKPKALDPIYDRNVEFVNTSKNIAKFKSFAEEKKYEETQDLQNVDEFGFVQDEKEDCNLCENKVKHFDHSRRLSKAIKEDKFDELFNPHISEKYLNIHAEKHLNLGEEFSSNLFSRTEQMMTNSRSRVKMEDNEGQSEQKFSLFSEPVAIDDEEFEEGEVAVNMKTALIAETYFGKRKTKK